METCGGDHPRNSKRYLCTGSLRGFLYQPYGQQRCPCARCWFSHPPWQNVCFNNDNGINTCWFFDAKASNDSWQPTLKIKKKNSWFGLFLREIHCMDYCMHQSSKSSTPTSTTIALATMVWSSTRWLETIGIDSGSITKKKSLHLTKYW